jgi:FHS family Na+ dependent glucose MFS transporter 1
VPLFLRTPSPAIPRGHAEAGAPVAPTRWLLVSLLAAMFFLLVGAELSYGGWIYTYAISLDLATATTAGYLTSLFWASLTLGRLISIPVAARVRPRYLLVGLAVSLVLLLLFSSSQAILWIATIGFGLSTANAYPTLLVLAERHLRISAKITSIFLVGGSLGSMTVPWLIGQRFETSGPQIMMVVLLAIVILTAVVLAAFLLAIRPNAAPVPGEGVRS